MRCVMVEQTISGPEVVRGLVVNRSEAVSVSDILRPDAAKTALNQRDRAVTTQQAHVINRDKHAVGNKQSVVASEIAPESAQLHVAKGQVLQKPSGHQASLIVDEIFRPHRFIEKHFAM